MVAATRYFTDWKLSESEDTGNKIYSSDCLPETYKKGGIANDSSELIAEEQGTASGTVENGQASGTEGMQEETEQASVAGTEAGNGSDEKGQGAQSTGDSATETGNATENAGENMSANLSQRAGADASVSGSLLQNTGGHNLTSENAADISGGTADSSARYYTVKKGDSLMSISKAVYHTTAMIPEICNANQIENMDMIYEGQAVTIAVNFLDFTVKMHYDISDVR